MKWKCALQVTRNLESFDWPAKGMCTETTVLRMSPSVRRSTVSSVLTPHMELTASLLTQHLVRPFHIPCTSKGYSYQCTKSQVMNRSRINPSGTDLHLRRVHHVLAK